MQPRRFRIALVLGGLGLALSGGVQPRPRADGREVIASVNDVPIPGEALAHALQRGAAAGSGAGGPAGRAATAESVLVERLIDEELLVQRARELGIVESDRSVRKALVSAVLERVKDEAARETATEAELRAFHASNAMLFATSRRLRVRVIRFDARAGEAAALERARAAEAEIAGGASFDDVAARAGDRPGLPVPDALLPEAVLRRELGPTLSGVALALPEGGVSAPALAGDAVHLLKLVELAPGAAAPFESVRERVAHEWKRRRGEAGLERLVAGLRARATIVLAPDAPSS